MSYNFPQDYAAMRDECVEVARSSGWQDKPISFLTAMSLLHSEASEALEAWRQWGFEDATRLDHRLYLEPMGANCKPEGVGSELADVLIRLLHYDGYFKLYLETFSRPGLYGLRSNFAENIAELHVLIALATSAYDLDSRVSTTVNRRLADVLKYLAQMAEHYDVDLSFEYNRKIAYNRTRPYRHGNKQA